MEQMEEEVHLKTSPVQSGKLKMAKAMLHLSAMIFIAFGGSLIAVGMYVQLDHGFVSEIIGSAVYQAAAYVAIVAGFLVLCLGTLGALSAQTERRWQLIVYITALLILGLLVLVSGLLAMVFRATLIETTKATMRSTLRVRYGKTRLITEAWDLTQARLRCCAVETNGWADYIGSEWDLMINADARNLQQRLPAWSPLYRFVPDSCCLSLIDPRTLWPSGRYKDLDQCRYFPYGPPNYPNGGFNDALYYRGCYNAGAEFLSSHGRFLSAIGFLLFVAMIAGLVSALTVVARTDPEAVKLRKAANRVCFKSDALLLSGGVGGY